MPSQRIADPIAGPTSMFIAQSFLSNGPSVSLLDGSESDGTNLLLTSGNKMLAADWDGANTVDTQDAEVAPDGTTTAMFVKENSANDAHIIFQLRLGAYTADSFIRFSVYAKMNGRRYLQMLSTNASAGGDNYAYFDLQTGTVTDSGVLNGAQTTTNVSIEAALNGYYKCSAEMRNSASATNSYFIFSLSNVGTYGAPLASNRPSYAGDNTSGIYMWRAKVVQL